MIQLKDVLHYYFGAEFQHEDDYYDLTINKLDGRMIDRWNENCKLILRPLSDLTKEEMEICGNMIYDFSAEPELNRFKWQDFDSLNCAEQWHWLIAKQFDLFGLIKSGQAIDKTKMK